MGGSSSLSDYFLRGYSQTSERPELAPYVEEFKSLFKESLLAVVFYGSKLSAATAKPDSLRDFYVVATGYGEAYGGDAKKTLLNKFLLPNVFYLPPRNGRIGAKYCVISFDDLERETGGRAADLYQLGRFCKRMAPVWTKSKEELEKLSQIQASAVLRAGELTLASLPESFKPREFMRALLALSYEADFRVEAEDKIDKIYASQETFYDEAALLALSELRAETLDAGRQIYSNPLNPRKAFKFKKARGRLLAKSRRRAVARWFKDMLTFDDWLDYVVAKVERAAGEKIILSSRERKHPLIFLWPRVFDYIRRGKLRKGAGGEK